MKIVILAAGEGKRLLPLTENLPKCLITIKAKSVLERIIENLFMCGLKSKDILIIAGHYASLIKEKYNNLKVVVNEDYKTKNNIYSVYLAKDHVADDMIILNSDIIFHPAILRKIVKEKSGNSIMVDMRETLTEEDMKVICENQIMRRISKEIKIEDARGEYIGIARFQNEGLRLLFSQIEKMLEKGMIDEWYERAFDLIARETVIGCLSTGGYPWAEIDTFDDLKKAEDIITMIERA